MSGALFSRIKNWVSGDTILAADVNAEFDNILANFIPTMMQGYSAIVNQMRTQTDPGEVGTESLATQLSGEIERLRFAISEIKGTTYWYTSASTSLGQLATALGSGLLANRISSGRSSTNSSQPKFLVPDGTIATVNLKGATTNLVYSVNGTQYTVSTDISASGLTTAAVSNNTCVVADASLAAQQYSKLVGENGTTLTVGTMGSNITALTGQIAGFKVGAEYFLARVESSTTLTKCMRGIFFNSADALLPRVTISNGDTITLMKLTWVYLTSAGGLVVSYTNPRYSGTAPTSPSTGDYWYDTVNNIWKTYNSVAWVDATAILVGICLQDSTGTKAARSFDFFKTQADTNTIEVIRDSITEVRSKFLGSQISVYGTVLKFDYDFFRWNTATDFDSGESLTTNKMYYFYVKESGNITISSVAPMDRRGDLKGYYHPGETYRCVGYGRTDATGSGTWQEVDSFYANDRNTLVTALTAAVSNLLPMPYNIQIKERIFKVDGTAGAFIQILPPAAQYKGETLTYVRTDSTIANVVTLQTYVSTELIYLSAVGSTTVTLNTSYEVYRLASDGVSWLVLEHRASTDWVSDGVLGLTATSVNPTKGAVSVDRVLWKRSGKHLDVRVEYRQSGAGGAAGTGDYLLAVPSSLVIDTTLITANTTVYGAASSPFTQSDLGTCWLAQTGAVGTGIISLYDSTHVRAGEVATSGGASIWSAGAFPTTQATLTFSANYSVPISGWLP